MAKKSSSTTTRKVANAKKPRSSRKAAVKSQSDSESRDLSFQPVDSQPIHPQAQSLFELHVQHELAAFDPPVLITWLRQNSEALRHWTKNISVEELVTREKIKSVCRCHVVDADIPRVVADLTNETILRLLNSSDHGTKKVSELMSDAQFDEFVEQSLVFEEQRASILDSLIDLPVYGDLISGVVYEAIIRYIYESNILTKKIPGVSSVLKIGRNMVNKTAPKLGGAVEEGVRSYIASNLDFILKISKNFLEESLTDEQIRKSARYVWEKLADQSLEELQRSNSNEQVMALAGLGYDFGLSIRKTAYFTLCVEIAVDSFFDQYGNKAISELMADVEIDSDKIVLEIERFLPEIVSTFKTSGCLETLLRARLREFYSSVPVFAFFEANSP